MSRHRHVEAAAAPGGRGTSPARAADRPRPATPPSDPLHRPEGHRLGPWADRDGFGAHETGSPRGLVGTTEAYFPGPDAPKAPFTQVRLLTGENSSNGCRGSESCRGHSRRGPTQERSPLPGRSSACPGWCHARATPSGRRPLRRSPWPSPRRPESRPGAGGRGLGHDHWSRAGRSARPAGCRAPHHGRQAWRARSGVLVVALEGLVAGVAAAGSGPTAGSRTVRSTRFPEPAWARSFATAPSSSPVVRTNCGPGTASSSSPSTTEPDRVPAIEHDL
ncbi:hypothetical protein ACVW19_002845 [Streptomyces sp. TE5632]